jgi:hypothetical protein
MNRLDRQFQVAVKIVQKLRKQEQGEGGFNLF